MRVWISVCLLLLLGSALVQALTLTWTPVVWPPGTTQRGYQLQRCHVTAPATTCTPVDAAGALVPSSATAYLATLPFLPGVDLWAVRAVGVTQTGVAQQSPPSNQAVVVTVAPASAFQALPGTTDRLAASADSQETGEAATRAADGQAATFWQTQWRTAQPGYQHWLLLDLGTPRAIRCLHYLPRQDATLQGRIKDYRIEIGMTPAGIGTVRTGTFAPNDLTRKRVCWAPQVAQYVGLYGLSSWDGQPFAAAAEVTLELEP